MTVSILQILGAALFAIAVLHSFLTRFFERLAQRHPRHAGVFHLLGEVEVVFGFWAMVLVLLMAALSGRHAAVDYLETRNFTEPMFVFVIMVIAASHPILMLVQTVVLRLSRLLPLPPQSALLLLLLCLVPLTGSFITEPAAMTLAALLLRDSVLAQAVSHRLRYATLGVLFVNISIGGTLTTFAAPPVLMVASTWQWDMAYMLTHFGGKAALACAINAAALVWLFRKELGALPTARTAEDDATPLSASLLPLVLLAGVVVFAHHPVVFMGLFLFFCGYTQAYPQHQKPLILREALLVGFFLGGLVVLGGLQRWWLEPVLLGMDDSSVYYGAAALTAITDNAALTYLGSLVPSLGEPFKQALVAGAVTGGGLTLIANAPNPAGAAILKVRFDDQVINPSQLLRYALAPTLVTIACMRWL